MHFLKYLGVGSIPWFPLARGFLTCPLGGESRRGETDDMIDFYDKYEGNREVKRRVEELATKKGKTMAQIALAWVMSEDPVAAPIVGTTSLQNLMDLIGRRGAYRADKGRDEIPGKTVPTSTCIWDLGF